MVANRFTVLAPPERPSARVRAGFAYDSRRKLFVLFGGVQDQFSQRHDDLWVFDPASELWSELPCSNRPSPRGGFYGMAYDEIADHCVLFGGRSTPQLWLDETRTLELRPEEPGQALYTFDRALDPGRERWFADVTQPADSHVTFLFRAGNSGAEWSSWGRSLADHVGQRFVQVAAILTPGTHGEAPSIQRMGLE